MSLVIGTYPPVPKACPFQEPPARIIPGFRPVRTDAGSLGSQNSHHADGSTTRRLRLSRSAILNPLAFIQLASRRPAVDRFQVDEPAALSYISVRARHGLLSAGRTTLG